MRAEYLLWSVQGGVLPALVVRDDPGTPRAAVGLPATPGRQVLFGESRLNDEMRSGFRIAGGVWLGDSDRLGISGDVFYLGSNSDGARFSSSGDPPLSRPFFNTTTGTADAELVSFPGVLSGSVAASERNTFVGAGGFIQYALRCGGDTCHSWRVDLLAGYRYYGLNDDLRIQEELLATGAGPVPAGTSIIVADRFRTENTFNGGLVGLSGGARYRSWSFDLRVGAAFGSLRRELLIEGITTVQSLGAVPVASRGGLLAQSSNIGSFSSETFTVVPEFGLTVGVRLADGVSLTAGYTFLYMPNTWRAGDQIDQAINPAQIRGVVIPGGRPQPTFASTGTVVNGLNIGLALQY